MHRLLGLLPYPSVKVETAVCDVQPSLPVNDEILLDDEILEGPTVLAHVDLARVPCKFISID